MSKFQYIKDYEKWREEFTYSIDIKIRFSETDMFGHMNNVSTFIYFEEARIEFMKHIGLFSINGHQIEVPIVADLQCDYHAQVYFGDKITLYVKANTIGNSSVDIHYLALKDNDKVCFTGRGNLVKINSTNGKSVPFSDEEKLKLAGEKSVIK